VALGSAFPSRPSGCAATSVPSPRVGAPAAPRPPNQEAPCPHRPPITPSAPHFTGAGLAGLLYKLLTGGFGDQLLHTLFDHVLSLLGIG